MKNQLTMTQAAQMANVSRPTIWRAIQGGELKAALTPTPFNHDVFMIEAKEFTRWLEIREQANKKPHG